MIPFTKQTENTSSNPFLGMVQVNKPESKEIDFADLLGNLNSTENLNQDIEAKSTNNDINFETSNDKELDAVVSNSVEEVATQLSAEEVNANAKVHKSDEVNKSVNVKTDSAENNEAQKEEASFLGSFFLNNVDLTDGKLVQIPNTQNIDSELIVSDEQLTFSNQSNANYGQDINIGNNVPEAFDISNTKESDVAISQAILEELGFSKVSIHENSQLRQLVIEKIHQLENMQNSSSSDIKTAKEIISNLGTTTDKSDYVVKDIFNQSTNLHTNETTENSKSVFKVENNISYGQNTNTDAKQMNIENSLNQNATEINPEVKVDTPFKVEMENKNLENNQNNNIQFQATKKEVNSQNSTNEASTKQN